MKYIKQIIFILYFFLSTSILCFAQKENDTVAKKERRVHFKIFFSPDLCYRINHSDIVGTENNLSESYSILAYNSNQETPNFGFQFGFLSEIKLTKKLFLTTGLAFEKMGYKTKKMDTVFAVNHYQGPPYYWTIINDMSIKFKYFYLSIPLTLSYQIRHKKTSVYPGIGIAFDYLIRYKREMRFATNRWWLNGIDKQEESYKNSPYFLSLNVSTGIGFQLRKKLILIFEPSFKYIFYRIGFKTKTQNITSPSLYLNLSSYTFQPVTINIYSLGLKINFKF